MVFRKSKRGQAAIEFLMTYGWMLLVVLIVGALIFSFVDFGSLLPNKLELSNNLRGDPTGSVAFAESHSGNASDQSQVKIVFRYNGAKRVTISGTSSEIETELGENCASTRVINLDTDSDSTDGTGLAFLNGQDGLMNFDCSSVSSNNGLLAGDSLVGEIRIPVTDPKTKLNVPSSGSLRMQISE